MSNGARQPCVPAAIGGASVAMLRDVSPRSACAGRAALALARSLE